jgi:hypothetical protein
MFRKFAVVVVLAAMLSGCGAAAHGGSIPSAIRPSVAAPGVPASSPAPLRAASAPARPDFLRTTPAAPRSAGSLRHTSGGGAHATFFNGEVALSNGVYYLQLSNGNIFGYYSYLTDTRYIYHFDMGYEFVVDANDGKGGVYLYDFASQHWWYTGAQYPFPYLYDFSLNAYVYYFPDSTSAGHYTTNPRYFNNFGNGAIITLPSAQLNPSSLSFTATGAAASQQFTISESGYQGAFTIDASKCNGIATIANVLGNTYTVAPVGAGTCNAIVGDTNSGRAALAIQVTPPPPQHLYIANASPAGGGIAQYTLPVTAGSAPNFTIATYRADSVGVAANGNVASGQVNGKVDMFSAPLSGTSAPAATFTFGQNPTGTQGIAFTPAGDFFISTAYGVNGFTHPFSNTSAPSSTITNAAMTYINGVALDAAQTMYLSNATSTTTNLLAFAPPYTGTPVVTPAIAGARYRGIAVTASRLFVGQDMGSIHRVDVYMLPLTSSSVPAFAITTGVHGPEGVALDSQGNLYVANFFDADVTVYAPPFSSASAPTVTLPVPSGFFLYSLAIGN